MKLAIDDAGSIHVDGQPALVCDPIQPEFSTPDFYFGGVHLLDHLMKVADKTNGMQVWHSLFLAIKTNMLAECDKKGFTGVAPALAQCAERMKAK